MTVHYPAHLFMSDTQLRTVRLHGSLRQFGDSFEISVTTPREAIRALLVIVPNFYEEFRKGNYRVVLGDQETGFGLDENSINLQVSPGREIHIIPVVEGSKDSGLGKILAGVALIALTIAAPHIGLGAIASMGVAGMTVGGMAMMTGVGMMLGGLAMMMAPSPQLPDYSSREEEDVSYLFNGVTNTVEEGGPLPVAFGGPIMTGSHVGSSGLDIEELELTDYGTINRWVGGGGTVGGGNPTPGFFDQFEYLFNNQDRDGISGYKGSKGGGNARSQRESPNTIASEAVARVIDIISSGDIGGFWYEDQPFRNLYLDDTVVQNPDGTTNFTGIEMNLRHGTADQDYIPGFSQTETPNAVGVKVPKATPVTRSIVNDPASGLIIDRVKVVLRIPALVHVDSETGNQNGTEVAYRIGIIPNGGSVSWIVTNTIREKFTSQFQKMHSVALPTTGHPYQIRVERLTDDSASATLQNDLWWDSYYEVVEAKLTYPGTALVGLTAYARQFGDRIPKRGYLMRGVICEIPSNYDPIARTYTGIWDGTFQRAWTNNPAWILWSVLTNTEWGLGKRIPRNLVDKWNLYEIGVYCDGWLPRGTLNASSFSTTAAASPVRKTDCRVALTTNVSTSAPGATLDGLAMVAGDRVLLLGQTTKSQNGIWDWNGAASAMTRSTDADTPAEIEYAIVSVADGTLANNTYLQVFSTDEISANSSERRFCEVGPRYDFNMWINSRESVYKAIQTIASSFRGMAIWGRGAIMATQDSPKTPRRLVTNANVHKSGFVYEGMGRKSIHTVAFVTWVNPANGWTASVEVVENPELIAKYGWRPIDIFAAGCTNRALARRHGLWALYTEQYESELVTFKGGFELCDLLPGDIVQVADNNQIGLRMGGRVRSATTTAVTLDKPFVFQSGVTYTLYVNDPSGIIHSRVLTNAPGTTDVCTFSSALASAPQGEFNSVFIITSDTVEPRYFRVMGVSELEDNEVEINASEYSSMKFGLIEQGTSFDPLPVTVFDSSVLPAPPSNISLTRMTTNTAGGLQESVEVRFDKSDSTLVTEYSIRWRYNFNAWTEIATTTNNASLPFRGPGQYDVIIMGKDVRGRFSVPVSYSSVITAVRPIATSEVTNLRIKGGLSTDQNFSGRILKLEWDVTTPTGYTSADWIDPYFRDYEIQLKTAGGTVLRTFYTTDRYFEISAEMYAEAAGSSARTFQVSVRARDTFGTIHVFQTQTYTNAAPTATVTVSSSNAEVLLRFTEPSDPDYVGIKVWMTDSSGFTPGSGNLVWSGTGQPTIRTLNGGGALSVGTTYYVKWAFVDEYGDGSTMGGGTGTAVPLVGISVVDVAPTPTITSPPTSFDLTASLTTNNDGSQLISLDATWDAIVDPTLAHYVVAIQEGAGTFVEHVVAGTSFKMMGGKTNQAYTGKVLAVDRFGNRTSFSATDSVTTPYDTTAPAAPTSITVVATFDAIVLKWTNAAAGDLDRVNIYRNTTNNSGTAALVDSVKASSGIAGVWADNGVGNGTTLYYWLKSVDTSGNETATFSTVATGTTLRLTPDDFRPKLDFSNVILDSDCLESDSWSLPVNGSLVTTADSNVTSLEANGAIKIASSGVATQYTIASYRVGGSILVPVQAGTAMRFTTRSRATAGFNGTVAAQIQAYKADGTLSSTAYPGSVVALDATVTPLGAATNYDVAINFVVPSDTTHVVVQLYSNWTATWASRGNAGDLYFSKPRMYVRADANLVVDGAITTNKLDAFAVTAAKIAANTITAAQIAAGTITATEIAASTITGAKIAATTITATNIAAQSITASRLTLTDQGNLVLDPGFADYSTGTTTYWVVTGAHGAIALSADPVVAAMGVPAAVRTVVGNGTTSQSISELYSSPNCHILVEPGKIYRVSGLARVTSGFTGRVRVLVRWFKADGTNASTANTSTFGPSYLTTAAGAETQSVIEGQVTAPADAYSARFSFYTDWSTTQNNAGYAYYALPRMHRAAQAELLVDGTITGTKIAAQTIAASNIVSGTITATQIAAQTITASKLIIGDSSNMFPDPDMQDLGSYVISASTSAPGTTQIDGINQTFQPSTITTASKNRLRVATTGAQQYVFSSPIPVEALKSYFFRIGAARDTTGAGQYTANIAWYSDAAGTTYLSVDTLLASGTSTTIVYGEGTFAAPSTARSCRFRFGIGTVTPGLFTSFYAPIMRRAASAELIVDGAITTNKLDALAVTAAKIAANTITAAQIAANTITASRLLIGDSSNMFTDPDMRDNTLYLTGASIGAAVVIDNNTTTGIALQTATETAASANRLLVNTLSGSSQTIWTPATPVEGGKPHFFSIAAYRVSGGGAYTIELEFYSDTAGLTATGSLTAMVTGGTQTTVTRYTANVNAATLARSMRYKITVGTGTATNDVYILEPIVRRAINGELIVDGQITASKIAAGTITANEIATGTITASLLSVGTLSSISANIGTVVAGLIQNHLTTPTYILDVANGYTTNKSGGYVTYQGTGFGASTDLLFWYGPDTTAIGAATKTNGSMALGTDGVMYYGAANRPNSYIGSYADDAAADTAGGKNGDLYLNSSYKTLKARTSGSWIRVTQNSIYSKTDTDQNVVYASSMPTTALVTFTLPETVTTDDAFYVSFGAALVVGGTGDPYSRCTATTAADVSCNWEIWESPPGAAADSDRRRVLTGTLVGHVANPGGTNVSDRRILTFSLDGDTAQYSAFSKMFFFKGGGSVDFQLRIHSTNSGNNFNDLTTLFKVIVQRN